jgi:hypothetical protein
MPADHKVNVAWQIVALFVPIANFWAFYRIRKLRMYLLLIALPSAIVSIVLSVYYFGRSPLEVNFSPRASQGLSFGDPGLFWPLTIIGNMISIALFGLSIYLVVKWSREHNQKYDQSMQT